MKSKVPSEVEQIKAAAGEYRKWALEARKKYIELRLLQDPEIRKLYEQAADKVARELRDLAGPSGQLRRRQLETLEKILRAEADSFTNKFSSALGQYIYQASDAGVGYSRAVLLNVFGRAGVSITGLKTFYSMVNRQAVEACWARTKGGLFLSDRIWQQGVNLRSAMRDVIQTSVATGMDAKRVARILQRYVREGKQTLAKDYPNMMKRMGSRIPEDMCYEALRLARTEMTAAFGEGTVSAARVSPSYIGMKWVLSHSHPVVDICDTLSAHDEGLGRGVYSPGNEPPFPAHPNCLCALVPVHEEPEAFVERLKRWKSNPGSEPGLEKWYNEIYHGRGSKEKAKTLIDKIQDIKDAVAASGSKPDEADIKKAGELIQAELQIKRVGIKAEIDTLKRQYRETGIEEIEKRLSRLRQARRNLISLSEVGLKTDSELRNEIDKLMRKRFELSAVTTKLENGIRDAEKRYTGNWKDNAIELRELLLQVREMGNATFDVDTHLNKSRSPMKKIVIAAYDHFPTDWVGRSVAKNKLTPKKVVGRGYYDGFEIGISGWDEGGFFGTAIHELGHRFEDVVPGIKDAEKIFYDRRTADDNLEWLGPGYGRNEKTRKDKFLSLYMGKDYGGRAYELVSMGFEYAYTNPTRLWQDEDYAQWIYGILTLL